MPLEYAEGIAQDLGRDVRDNDCVLVPFGKYSNLLVVEEWSPLEPDAIELKYYAQGIGTVMEETVRGELGTAELVGFTTP